MIPSIRAAFNAQFTEERYQLYLSFLNSEFKNCIPFRIAETPVFLDKKFKAELLSTGTYICDFITDQSFQSITEAAIPNGLHIPNETAFPACLVIDFAIAEGKDGNKTPQLIELQGFPSLFAFEILQAKGLENVYDLPKGFSPYLNSYDENSYKTFLSKMIHGDADKHTVLLEIKPLEQKTKLDLLLTEKWFDTPLVCLSEIYLKDNALYYCKEGVEIKIERIYNRVVYDELMQQEPIFIEKFNLLQKAVDIEWVNHPHHFFRISKFILPLLKHACIPDAYLLSDWSINKHCIEGALEDYICKPLFSFGGQGVMLEPTLEKLAAIKDPEHWILQRKVQYAACIETPSGPSKAEVRIFYFWDNAQHQYIAVNNLTRISKGAMIGVSYNDTATWIGGSISYFEQ